MVKLTEHCVQFALPSAVDAGFLADEGQPARVVLIGVMVVMVPVVVAVVVIIMVVAMVAVVMIVVVVVVVS